MIAPLLIALLTLAGDPTATVQETPAPVEQTEPSAPAETTTPPSVVAAEVTPPTVAAPRVERRCRNVRGAGSRTATVRVCRDVVVEEQAPAEEPSN